MPPLELVSEFKPLGELIVRITAIANDQIGVAAVHDDCVKAQYASISWPTDNTLFERAGIFVEVAIDNLHL